MQLAVGADILWLMPGHSGISIAAGDSCTDVSQAVPILRYCCCILLLTQLHADCLKLAYIHDLVRRTPPTQSASS